MSQILQKRKVIRNHGKRAKLGSHGFKVYKNTYVYIAKATEGGWSRDGKPAPKVKVVQALQKHFNTSKSIRKMVKHINGVKITYSDASRFAGYWVSSKQQFEYIDSEHMTPSNAVQVMIHEVDGHAFWDFAKKWRHSEWEAFNVLANKMPPVNDYVKKYLKNKLDYRTDSIYENEQHSAVTELIVNGSSYHTQLISESDLAKLKKAWELLHY
mgnify:CR=1 FL=1